MSRSLTAVILAFTSLVVLRGPGVGKRQRRAAGFTVRQQVKIHNQALQTERQTNRQIDVRAESIDQQLQHQHLIIVTVL